MGTVIRLDHGTKERGLFTSIAELSPECKEEAFKFSGKLRTSHVRASNAPTAANMSKSSTNAK